MKWYWFGSNGLPVTVHLKLDHRFEWTQIRGVQIGPWFIGAIRGVEVSSEDLPRG